MYDIPRVGRDLFAAFVITKQGPAILDSLDPSKALVTTDFLFTRAEMISYCMYLCLNIISIVIHNHVHRRGCTLSLTLTRLSQLS